MVSLRCGKLLRNRSGFRYQKRPSFTPQLFCLTQRRDDWTDFFRIAATCFIGILSGTVKSMLGKFLFFSALTFLSNILIAFVQTSVLPLLRGAPCRILSPFTGLAGAFSTVNQAIHDHSTREAA